MKLVDGIPFEKYNDVEGILSLVRENNGIGNDNVEPIQYFHCFWKGKVTDLHLMCLQSLKKVHPNSTIFLWTPNALEVQGSESWVKIRKVIRDKIILSEITHDHFKHANASGLYLNYHSLTSQGEKKGYDHNVAYASDIVRFVVLYLYGGVWFDLDILFTKSLDSIKIKRYVSQWGGEPCGNAAILRLEKGHDIIQNVLGKYNPPFYPTSTFRLENDLDITILPGSLFDIHWQVTDHNPRGSHLLSFRNWDEFFEMEELKLPDEIYGYHWHNRWSYATPPFFKEER